MGIPQLETHIRLLGAYGVRPKGWKVWKDLQDHLSLANFRIKPFEKNSIYAVQVSLEIMILLLLFSEF